MIQVTDRMWVDLLDKAATEVQRGVVPHQYQKCEPPNKLCYEIAERVILLVTESMAERWLCKVVDEDKVDESDGDKVIESGEWVPWSI